MEPEDLLGEKLEIIASMMQVMSQIKEVYFEDKKKKDEVINKAHSILMNKLNSL